MDAYEIFKYEIFKKAPQLPIIQEVLSNGFDVNSQSPYNKNFTLLCEAVVANKCEALEYLLDKKAKVYMPGTKNPLFLPAINFDQAYQKNITLLLENGANVISNKTYKLGWNPFVKMTIIMAQYFINAAKNSNLDGMKQYLQDPLIRNVTDETGNTALHYSVLNQREDIVDFLLPRFKTPKDLMLKNLEEKTAIDLAAQNNKCIWTKIVTRMYELNQKN